MRNPILLILYTVSILINLKNRDIRRFAYFKLSCNISHNSLVRLLSIQSHNNDFYYRHQLMSLEFR